MKQYYLFLVIVFYSIAFSQPFYIYTDSLHKKNWHAFHSWNVSYNLQDSSHSYSGKYSISIEFKNAYGGFNLFLSNLNTSGYDTLVFFVNGGENSNQTFWIKLSFDGKNFSEGKSITDYTMIESNKWKRVAIPLSDLMNSYFSFVSLLFQESKGQSQPKIFIDNIYLTAISGNPRILDVKFDAYNFYPLSKVKINAKIEDEDGIMDITKVKLLCDEIVEGFSINLYDDGNHYDERKDDGIFGNQVIFPSNSQVGEKRVVLSVEDRSGKRANQEIWVGVLRNDSVPIPAGLFNYLSIGTATNTSNLSWQTNNGGDCWDMGYQYITWDWWNWHTEFVKRFCDDAARRGYIPVISIYMLQQAPIEFGCSGSEYDKIYCAINNPAIMEIFWQKFIRMCHEIKSSLASYVIIHVEPDMLGYLQQRAINENKSPRDLTAFTGNSRYPDNLVGMHQRMIDIVQEIIPNKGLLAFHVSLWGNVISLKDNEEKYLDIKKLAEQTASFLKELSPNFDLIFMDWSDRDAGFDGVWWDKRNISFPNFSRVLMFTNYISVLTGKKVILWQIPIGNETLPNKPNQYADNRLDYVFDYAKDIARSGIISLLFGAGIPGMTTQFTDGGYLKERALNYCREGKINLLDDDFRDSTKSLPVDLILYQNYPNPFSSFSHIRFYLPDITDNTSKLITEKTRATMKLYNILGKEVATIFDEFKLPGKNYEIKLSTSSFNLPSGVYFLELNYGGFRKMIKIMIIK